jgi:DNA-directed RNA polymerase specialized sigma24 family protein
VSVTAPPQDSLKTAAIELLDVHRAAVEREKRTRLYLILAARDHGLTYEEIGDALGMTGAGVRLLVKRSGGSV